MSYLDAPADPTAPLLRVVLEASESPSQHRVFVYRGEELLGQLPAMNADVHVQPGEVALLTFGIRVSTHAQVKSVSFKREPRDPTNVSS
jgi:hypothetical protein